MKVCYVRLANNWHFLRGRLVCVCAGQLWTAFFGKRTGQRARGEMEKQSHPRPTSFHTAHRASTHQWAAGRVSDRFSGVWSWKFRTTHYTHVLAPIHRWPKSPRGKASWKGNGSSRLALGPEIVSTWQDHAFQHVRARHLLCMSCNDADAAGGVRDLRRIVTLLI